MISILFIDISFLILTQILTIVNFKYAFIYKSMITYIMGDKNEKISIIIYSGIFNDNALSWRF